MSLLQLLRMALRYSVGLRAGYLSSFLSLLSMLGIALAITLLVIVLSVMNGFDREMRERILGLVPQLTVKSWEPFSDWQQHLQTIRAHEQVVEVAPYVQLQAMLVHKGVIDTAVINGFADVPDLQPRALSALLPASVLAAFNEDSRAMVLGSALARKLDLEPGDRVTLIVPSTQGLNAPPRYQYLTLLDTMHSGTELDESAAFMHLPLAAELAGIEGRIHGFRVGLDDLFMAPRVGWELAEALPPGFYSSDWTMTHGNLYAAIQLSRDMIGILLLSIIAIAAFNVVSSLVLVVIDKHSDIAILMALGATPRQIHTLFLLQGSLIAVAGIILGTALGVAGSVWIADVVAWLERLLSIQFLRTDVYPISYLPSDLRISDLLLINAVTIVMCFLAALYPARRASRLLPAEALRHD